MEVNFDINGTVYILKTAQEAFDPEPIYEFSSPSKDKKVDELVAQTNAKIIAGERTFQGACQMLVETYSEVFTGVEEFEL